METRSGCDTGSGTETRSGYYTGSGTETRSGYDTGSGTETRSGYDTGSGTETRSGYDTGSGTETRSGYDTMVRFISLLPEQMLQGDWDLLCHKPGSSNVAVPLVKSCLDCSYSSINHVGLHGGR